MADILTEAGAIINGERQDQYGAPEDSFKLIADYWTAYISADSWDGSFSALDVAHMMALLKIARMQGQGFKRDNYVDACGYLAIAADRLADVPEAECKDKEGHISLPGKMVERSCETCGDPNCTVKIKTSGMSCTKWKPKEAA